jgi:hypothetical protein
MALIGHLAPGCSWEFGHSLQMALIGDLNQTGMAVLRCMAVSDWSLPVCDDG